MAGLPRLPAAEVHRVRRFDAVVLGAALPGLVAAIRLAQRGARVAVVEEESAARAHPGWREPFLLWDAEPSGVLGACLRALAVPLIDQRRLVADDLALQIVTPRARLDWGRLRLAAAELTAWGFAKPDEARSLLRELAAAAETVRDALLASIAPRAKRGGALTWRRPAPAAAEPAPAPTWPEAQADASPALRALLRDLAMALSEQAGLPPEPAALRLLGTPLAAGGVVTGEAGLRHLLWRRLGALFGERREIPGRLRLMAASHLAAIEAPGVPEIFAGRALILNAPREALAEAHEGPPPALLRTAPATHLRVGIELRAPSGLLPEAMAPRVIVQSDGCPLRIARYPGRRSRERDELIASTVVPRGADEEAVRARLERAVRELAPFCGERLERRPPPDVRWDRDDLLHQAAADASARDALCALRLSTRPRVIALERGESALHGFEGDLLLGWRAGDELLAELE